MGYHLLLQGIFPTEGSNPGLSRLLHGQAGSLPLALPGEPWLPLFFSPGWALGLQGSWLDWWTCDLDACLPP